MSSRLRRTFSTWLYFLMVIWTCSMFIAPTDGRSWRAGDLPNPQEDSEGICGRRGLKSVICDPDGYLSKSDGDTIDGLSNFIHDGTNGFHAPVCDGEKDGPQLAVAVISSMSGLSSDKSDMAFQFARALHDKWGVGNPHCQNGVVLLFSVKDRALGISVGAGFNHILLDSIVPTIISSQRGKLRKEEYGPAIIDAVTMIGNILSGQKVSGSYDDDTGATPLQVGAIFLSSICCFLMCCACAVHDFVQPTRYERCRALLDRLDEDRGRASRREYVAKSCPICMEDFDEEETENENKNKGDKRASNSTVLSMGGEDNGINRAYQSRGSIPLNEAHSQSTSNGIDEHTQLMSDHNNTSSSGTATNNANDMTPCSETGHRLGTSTEGAKNQLTLPCGHSFHEECVLSWFSSPGNSNGTCPVCRQPVVAPGDVPDGPDESDRDSSTTTTTPTTRIITGVLRNSTGVLRNPTRVLRNSTGVRRNSTGVLRNSTGGMGWDAYDNEYRFRLRRAQNFYPDFITWSMIDTWERDRHNLHRPMASNLTFVAVDPAALAAIARSSGGGGSSYSFGGGSSSSGGGGGGGW